MSDSDKDSAQAPGRSWRDIRQEVKPLAMSRKGRSRRRLHGAKITALTTFLVLAGWGVYEIVHTWDTNRAALAKAVQSDPVRDIVLITDGVLTKTWIRDTLDLPKTARLMSLELETLRDQLLTHGQVQGARLRRNFPDTLVVTVNERTPVARVQISEGLGQTRQLLVARDGMVYDGFNYEKQMVQGLPWLDGIRLVKTKGVYQPIAGMSEVAALLAMAQLQAPHLYRSWTVVSLARLFTRDEIVVQAKDVQEIVFSRKRDYFKQIAQLDYVVDAARVLPDPTLLSVNLVLEGQVPVKMLSTPDELASVSQSNLSLQSSQRKGKRDL